MAIFAVNASMIMFGALQEKYETPGNGKGLPFIFGSMTESFLANSRSLHLAAGCNKRIRDSRLCLRHRLLRCFCSSTPLVSTRHSSTRKLDLEELPIRREATSLLASLLRPSWHADILRSYHSGFGQLANNYANSPAGLLGPAGLFASLGIRPPCAG